MGKKKDLKKALKWYKDQYIYVSNRNDELRREIITAAINDSSYKAGSIADATKDFLNSNMPVEVNFNEEFNLPSALTDDYVVIPPESVDESCDCGYCMSANVNDPDDCSHYELKVVCKYCGNEWI